MGRVCVWGGFDARAHAHTHAHTNMHVKLCILTGGDGLPAMEPDPTAGRMEAGKGVCGFVWDLHRVFGANKG